MKDNTAMSPGAKKKKKTTADLNSKCLWVTLKWCWWLKCWVGLFEPKTVLSWNHICTNVRQRTASIQSVEMFLVKLIAFWCVVSNWRGRFGKGIILLCNIIERHFSLRIPSANVVLRTDCLYVILHFVCVCLCLCARMEKAMHCCCSSTSI